MADNNKHDDSFLSICSFVAFLALIPFMLSSCGSSENADFLGLGGGYGGPNDTQPGSTSTISGVAQKGQFLRGSSITIYALNKNLAPSGLSYPTQTSDDMGAFTVSNINAEYVDIKANGYYFNENKGETSSSPITLQALSTTKSKVNVNLLTTLAYNRIKHLVDKGQDFNTAQNRAQSEVLKALGLGTSTSANFTDMNIAGSGDANGLLLAASVLIQQNRSVGDVSKLISDIAADIEKDGTLSDELNQEVHRYESSIYVGDIINGLISFYEKNKVVNYSIPTFYKFLDSDGDGKMDGTEGYVFMGLDANNVVAYNPLFEINPGYSASGFSITEHILSTIPFKAESDAEWLTVKKSTVAENIYAVEVEAQANTGENRTAHVIFSDNSGKEIRKYTYQQQAPGNLVDQRLVFMVYPSMVNYMPTQVGVNGKTYNLHLHDNGYGSCYESYYYVDVPYGDRQDKYQTYFPTSMISMPNGYGKYMLTIPENITSDEFPFISLRDQGYIPIGNPSYISIMPACPSVYLSSIESIDHIVLTSDAPICGTATYAIVDERPRIVEQVSGTGNNGQYSYTVKVIQHPDAYRVFIPVLQSDVPVRMQCFDAAGQLVYEYTDYSRYYNFYEGGTR